MTHPFRLAWLALAIAACTPSQPAQTPTKEPAATESTAAEPAKSESDSHQAGPVGTKLVRDVTESPETFVIGEGGPAGLNGVMISQDGKELWPPTGPHCEKLVSCCQTLAAEAKPVALSCLLAIARDKDCSVAFATVRAIVTEQSYAMPNRCEL